MTNEEKMRLIDAPVGLLECNGTIIMKTEYMTQHDDGSITPDCYIVESGEYFCGGAETAEELKNLEVKPVCFNSHALQSVGKDITDPTKDDHFREVRKMIPLTIEELRKMDGQPVWTELIKPTQGKSEGWSIVYKDNGSAAVQRWTTWTLWYEEYGKTWTAYAYPPSQINQEVWKPCEFCSIEMNCTNCDNADRPTNMEPCASCRLTSNGKTNWKYSKTLYCRVCGRPLTEEAWAEMEKRLRG